MRQMTALEKHRLDCDMARICAWLLQHGYTCHVKLNGSLELRKKLRT